MTAHPLGQFAINNLEKRGIDPETVAKLGVYTAKRAADGTMHPDARGDVVAFPFLEHGVEVGTKYRARGKKFWQREGGKRTFWNADVMDDPALHDGRQALIITEGEIDALSAIDCGFPFTVSVPDGAPSVPQGKAADELDPLDEKAETTGKFEFMYNNRDRLKRIKRFIIAVDADAPGRRLAAEIVRRLSAAKCAFVSFPSDAVVPDGDGGKRACKDLNEVLMHLGRDKVVEVLNAAKPYPVRGLYRLSEYPESEALDTFPVGWDGWSTILRVFMGELMVVTGVPSHGKSTWVLNLLWNLANIHGWTIALFSPEMPAVPILRDRLRRLTLKRRPDALEVQEIAKADAWSERHFVFIDADPTGSGDSDEPFDLAWIIDRATDAVLREGIRVLVIDPWNEVDHARERNESAVDYIARGLRMLKRFARQYGVMVIIVAHPTKDVNKDGKQRQVNLYDIEGAAHWFNKCDHGIVVERPQTEAPESTIHILKCKFDETGKRAKMKMSFDKESGAFTPISDWD